MTRFDVHDFQAPSRSEDVKTTCVELACGGGVVELRDSKVTFGSPEDHRLRLTYAQFDAFQQGVRAGNTNGLPLIITTRTDGMFEFRPSAQPDAAPLTFNQAELDVFYHDIHAGQYDARILAAT